MKHRIRPNEVASGKDGIEPVSPDTRRHPESYLIFAVTVFFIYRKIVFDQSSMKTIFSSDSVTFYVIDISPRRENF